MTPSPDSVLPFIWVIGSVLTGLAFILLRPTDGGPVWPSCHSSWGDWWNVGGGDWS